ncbi:hypothetical protein AKJ57_02680 [candidate division MSBL1 archaeon SCGC-AAA259A05]|uniref:Uncharacterized protein n=1 Tax=candidate division MSBL1 archaeon SCGC-AAA259A05 TaxID=1698259 RepID=A0A133UA03_9EURY|nr:hypothetical protein AKJ57_02680 [candidate division MSBL1 archaeon SCGC-AAA259A05]
MGSTTQIAETWLKRQEMRVSENFKILTYNRGMYCFSYEKFLSERRHPREVCAGPERGGHSEVLPSTRSSAPHRG